MSILGSVSLSCCWLLLGRMNIRVVEEFSSTSRGEGKEDLAAQGRVRYG